VKIRSGDKVRVLTGKDRGAEGEVLKAFPRDAKVIVEGVHAVKRHSKPRDATTPGSIIEKSLPIHVSNVAILCDSCGPTRVAIRRDAATGHRVRVCRKCGGEL